MKNSIISSADMLDQLCEALKTERVKASATKERAKASGEFVQRHNPLRLPARLAWSLASGQQMVVCEGVLRAYDRKRTLFPISPP